MSKGARGIQLLFMVLLVLGVLVDLENFGEKRTEITMAASELYCDDSKFYGGGLLLQAKTTNLPS